MESSVGWLRALRSTRAEAAAAEAAANEDTHCRRAKRRSGSTKSQIVPGSRSRNTGRGPFTHCGQRFCDLRVSSFFLQRALRPGLKSLLARARENGLTTSVDPGFDPYETWGKDLIDTLNEVDVFLPNEVELAAISGEKNPTEALRSLENGRTFTIAKLGANGCIAMDRGEILRVPAFPVTPLDTTGAGDTFNAGFLHAWLSGSDLRYAMRFGAACGALSTLGLGGTANQPTEAEAHEFMAGAAAAV